MELGAAGFDPVDGGVGASEGGGKLFLRRMPKPGEADPGDAFSAVLLAGLLLLMPETLSLGGDSISSSAPGFARMPGEISKRIPVAPLDMRLWVAAAAATAAAVVASVIGDVGAELAVWEGDVFSFAMCAGRGGTSGGEGDGVRCDERTALRDCERLLLS